MGTIESVRKAHELYDKYLALLLEKAAQQGEVPPCKKGCFFCCYEPVYVSMQEAKLVSSLIRQRPAEELEKIKAEVRRQVEVLKASGLLKQEQPPVGLYRALRLLCPMIKDGACSVYEDRPFGCRGHVARGSSKGCEDDELRKTQQFLFTAGLMEEPMKMLMRETRHLQMDHLLLFLHELLNGEVVRSEAYAEVVVEN